jgi:hypothetical protein
MLSTLGARIKTVSGRRIKHCTIKITMSHRVENVLEARRLLVAPVTVVLFEVH